MREEVGIGVERLTLASVHQSQAEGKRDTIHLFSALHGGYAGAGRQVEVEEARFFPLDALPADGVGGDFAADRGISRRAAGRGRLVGL